MNYNPDDFLRLMEEAERQGGAHLPDRCEPGSYDLDMPNGSGRRTTKTVKTSGCGQETQFVLPYDPAQKVEIPGYGGPENADGEPKTATVSANDAKAMNQRLAGLLTVCAVDDNVGLWPRFANVVEV